MVKGIKIGNIEILSISQIIEKNNQLDEEIDEVNTLNNITYKRTLTDLNDATKKLISSRTNYFNIASVSSEDEIRQANQDQSYAMEYLWSKIGNHATAEGVNIKLEVTSTNVSNKNNLNFTIQGSYIAIINFIYSLEDDEDLNFRIENFKLVTGASSDSLNCTFLVSDIGIKKESVTSSVTSSKSNEKDNSQTTDNNE